MIVVETYVYTYWCGCKFVVVAVSCVSHLYLTPDYPVPYPCIDSLGAYGVITRLSQRFAEVEVSLQTVSSEWYRRDGDTNSDGM